MKAWLFMNNSGQFRGYLTPLVPPAPENSAQFRPRFACVAHGVPLGLLCSLRETDREW